MYNSNRFIWQQKLTTLQISYIQFFFLKEGLEKGRREEDHVFALVSIRALNNSLDILNTQVLRLRYQKNDEQTALLANMQCYTSAGIK